MVNSQTTVKRFFQLITTLSAVIGTSYAQDDSPSKEAASARLSIVTDPISQSQIYISVNHQNRVNGLSSFFLESHQSPIGVSSNSVGAAGKSYLNGFSESVQIDGQSEDFVESVQKQFHDGSRFVSYKQHKYGIPVYGAEMKVHFDANGKLSFINGSGNSLKASSKTANLSKEEAVDRAKIYVSQVTKIYHLNAIQKKMLAYQGPSAELVYYPKGDQLELCWVIDYRPSFTENLRTIVSAEDGQQVSCYSLVCQADGHVTSKNSKSLNGKEAEVAVYKQNDTYYLLDTGQDMFEERENPNPVSNPKGVIITYDAQKSVNSDNRPYISNGKTISGNTKDFGTTTVQQSAVSAQVNASKWYQKVKGFKHGFNSWDNAGGGIQMYVNVNDASFGSQSGVGLDNAQWIGNGIAIFGGSGVEGKELFKSPTSKGLDVVAHELTHGILESGPNLQHDNPFNAALKEALCDMVASIVDGNYHFGENSDVTRRQGYLRSAKTPHAGIEGSHYSESYENNFTANHMNEFVPETGAKYYNSTIISRAFYELAGETGNDGIGQDIAGELLMRTIHSLSSNADFYEFRNLFIAHANEYLGEGVAAITVIKNAFASVGLAVQEVDFDILPTINGDNFIFCNIKDSPGDNMLLFKKDDTKSDFSFVEDEVFNQQTQLRSSVSITDEGDCIYGVNADHQIVKIDYSTDIPYRARPDILSISKGTRVSEVAISKKNERLAYTSMEKDASIFIYDRKNEAINTFHLDTTIIVEKGGKFYNGEILRVGKMEWDYEGSRIIFEFESAYLGNKGDTLGKVWNIGEIEVWDLENDLPKDGRITLPQRKIFHYNDLRNPSFSKNTTTIIIYDQYNHKEEKNSIIAWDRTPGRVRQNIVYEGKVLGHPSYSNTDKQLIFTDLSTTGEPALYIIELTADKISRSSQERIKIISDAKNPVWFTVGVRSTSIKPITPPSGINEKSTFYPNPTNGYIKTTLEKGSGRVLVYSLSGQVLIETPYNAGDLVNTTSLENGQYVIELLTESGRAVSVITKE